MFAGWRRIRADRKRWAQARSIADLGELMAGWLEGDVVLWPGYQPGFGPDEETGPHIPILARANRAGYLTDQSQAGCVEDGIFGVWRQRAAVSGLVIDGGLRHRLLAAASRYGLVVVESHVEFMPDVQAWVVTEVDGEAYTGFGAHMPVRVLRGVWRGVNRDAFSAITSAWQITLLDPEWGREDRLWPALDAALQVHHAVASP